MGQMWWRDWDGELCMTMREEDSRQADVKCYTLPGSQEQIIKENTPIIGSLDISVLEPGLWG
jgi:hypothetical protein